MNALEADEYALKQWNKQMLFRHDLSGTIGDAEPVVATYLVGRTTYYRVWDWQSGDLERCVEMPLDTRAVAAHRCLFDAEVATVTKCWELLQHQRKGLTE